MPALLTEGLFVAAAGLGGILAGASADRSVVQLPAWKRVGTLAWAIFSRQADLGSGLLWYPVLGLGAPIATVGAAIAARMDSNIAGNAAFPTTLAAVLAVAHLFATSRAAPNMLAVGRVGDDERLLARALDRFTRWQAVSAVLQVLTFAANLWSLVWLSTT
jgi:hypothetical protein